VRNVARVRSMLEKRKLAMLMTKPLELPSTERNLSEVTGAFFEKKDLNEVMLRPIKSQR
jgi:hypothetical protein